MLFVGLTAPLSAPYSSQQSRKMYARAARMDSSCAGRVERPHGGRATDIRRVCSPILRPNAAATCVASRVTCQEVTSNRVCPDLATKRRQWRWRDTLRIVATRLPDLVATMRLPRQIGFTRAGRHGRFHDSM